MYFYLEIVHRHIQISPPNPVSSWFDNGIQMTMYKFSKIMSLKIFKTNFMKFNFFFLQLIVFFPLVAPQFDYLVPTINQFAKFDSFHEWKNSRRSTRILAKVHRRVETIAKILTLSHCQRCFDVDHFSHYCWSKFG